METLYKKTKNGDYIPVEFNQVLSKDWNNHLIWIKLGTELNPVSENVITEMYEALDNISVFEELNDTTFMVTSHNVDFSILANIDELKKKFVSIQISSSDDLTKLKNLQNQAKALLRQHAKKVVIMPVPLTIEEYQEVIEIKRRSSLRKKRRGR